MVTEHRPSTHQIGVAADLPDERSQRQELPIREELAPSVEAVPVHRKGSGRPDARLGCRLVQQSEGNCRIQVAQFRIAHARGFPLDLGRQAVFLPLLPVHHDGGHALADPSRASPGANIPSRDDRAAAGTLRAAPAHRAGAQVPVVLALLRGASAALGNAPLDAEGDTGAVLPRFHREQHALLRRLAQPARLEQRDLRPAVAAPHRARPEIRHRRLRHPARIRLVFQMERIELRVERDHRHLPVLVRVEQASAAGADNAPSAAKRTARAPCAAPARTPHTSDSAPPASASPRPAPAVPRPADATRSRRRPPPDDAEPM